MSRGETRLPDYLEHIDQAVRRISTYISGVPKEGFLENQLLQDAVLRNLEIIGEASRNIIRSHPEFVENNAGLPLKSAYEMRNALAHGYFEVDLEIVWQTIIGDLPNLANQIVEIRNRRALDDERGD